MNNNIYIPQLATIDSICQETADVKTLRLKIDGTNGNWAFQAGQFVELSVFGVGESPFCIASSPNWKGYIECSIKRMGKVTNAVHQLNEGDKVGIRGPFGNYFPIEKMKGKNLIIVGGGIGLAPLRPLIWHCIDNKNDFQNITVIAGARTVGDLVYKDDLKKWTSIDGIKTILTVDTGGENAEWKGKVGLLPDIFEQENPSPNNSILVTCGPPVMIKFMLKSAEKLGFIPEQVITTLERRMQCAFGKCGHCMIGGVYVCKEGPVFSYSQIKELYEEI